MSDDDRFMNALIGYGVWQNVAAARQQAEYQRQQLNLLRRHQGLPPIPPDPPDQTWNGIGLLTGWSACLGIGVTVGVLLHTHLGGTWQPWGVGTWVTWWLGGRVRRFFAGRVERREAAYYDAWRQAGCP